MSRARRRLLLWIAAVVALGGILGVTLALWRADASVPTAGFQSGALDLTAVGEQSAANVSPDDFNGAQHEGIGNLSQYPVLPGDTIRVAQTVAVRLDGDNVSGALSVEPRIADGPAAQYVRATPAVYAGTFTALNLPDEAVSLPRNDAGDFLITGATTASYTIVLSYTFDPDTPDLTGLPPEVVETESVGISLRQIRPDGTPVGAAVTLP